MNALKWLAKAMTVSAGCASLLLAQTTHPGGHFPAPETRAIPTSGPTSAPRERRYDLRLREQCSVIARAVGFTEQQYQQLEKNIAALEKAKEEWVRANGQKLDRLAREVHEARKAKDRLRIRALEEKLRPLLEDRDKVFGNDRDVIESIMTDEQKTAEEGWRFARSAMRIYEDVAITDAQKARIKELCMAAGAEKRRTTTFRQANAVRKKLMKTILDEVLTHYQRITYMAAKLNRSAMGHYARTGLTERQSAQILQLCRKYGAQQLGVTDWRELARIRRALLYDVYHEVLTDEQRLKVERTPARPRGYERMKSLTTLPTEGPPTETQPARSAAKDHQGGGSSATRPVGAGERNPLPTSRPNTLENADKLR